MWVFIVSRNEERPPPPLPTLCVKLEGSGSDEKDGFFTVSSHCSSADFEGAAGIRRLWAVGVMKDGGGPPPPVVVLVWNGEFVSEVITDEGGADDSLLS